MQSFHTGSMAQGSVGEGTESVRWLEGLLVGDWFGAMCWEPLVGGLAWTDDSKGCWLSDDLKGCW